MCSRCWAHVLCETSAAYSMVGLRAALEGGLRVPLSAMKVLPALSTGQMVQCQVCGS